MTFLMCTTPRSLTVAPPSALTSPPIVADVTSKVVIAVVEIVGNEFTVIVPVAFTLPQPPNKGML